MATFAMMKETADRRTPAGEGIVVRPMGAKFGHTVECRYCHEEGHMISVWNHRTRAKMLTCPKLIAKEQRAQQRAQWAQQRQQVTQRQPQRSLGAWMPSANTLKRAGAAQVGWTNVGNRRGTENMLQKQLAKTTISNRFSELEGQKAPTPSHPHRVAPEACKAREAVGAWAPDANAEALLKRKRANQKKSVSFAGDHEDLMKPPCSIVCYDSDEPVKEISALAEGVTAAVEAAEKLVSSPNAWKPKRLAAAKASSSTPVGDWADAEEEDLSDFFAQPLTVGSI